MKTLGIAIYHSNVQDYPSEWLRKCLGSLYLQEPTNGWEYLFFELNYGPTNRNLLGLCSNAVFFRSRELNYAAAMNYIYQHIIDARCDAIANVNIDDWYALDRFKNLLPQLDQGFDIVSSNYIITDENGREKRRTDFADLNVSKELMAGNNIISNPCHIMRKEVFKTIQFKPDLVPVEDLVYWQDCLKAGFKIRVLANYLHWRREHPGQEGNKKNRQSII
jgi:hypothetical protein